MLTRCRVCRNEIASCEEAAYDSLPVKDAATLLFFKSKSDLVTFAQQVRIFHDAFTTTTNLISSNNHREVGR